MRPNRYGIRGLKCVRLKRGPVYFWTPPLALLKAGVFHTATLGTDLTVATERARYWNAGLDAYRSARAAPKPKLGPIKPMTVGFLIRQLEASPKFALYSLRTRQDYSWIYRDAEAQVVDEKRMLGDVPMTEVTRQLAFSVYERLVERHGRHSANKSATALQAAFSYAALKFAELTSNPFSRLAKLPSASRRQRWTDQQLAAFIARADELGCASVGRCALICMELMQRPGDVLSLRWGAYDEIEHVWQIRQTKRGAVVRVPETARLREALRQARRSAMRLSPESFDDVLVCPTVRGKRWHRRNFTKAARLIARAAGIPDDLQIRDLRRTAATEGASAGATPAELMAVGGWANQASIRPYLVYTSEQAASFQAKRDTYRARKGPLVARAF